MDLEKTSSIYPNMFGQDAYRILMVEDSFSDAFVFQRFLNREIGSSKITWTHAQLVDSALEILKSQRFDLIISDLSLPDGSGAFNTVQQIYAHAHDTPIIVLTGFLDVEMKKSLKAIPVQAYLIKGESETSSVATLISQIMKQFRHEKQRKQRERAGKKYILLLDPHHSSYALIRQVLYNPQKGLIRHFDCELLHVSSIDDVNELLSLHSVDVVFFDLDGINIDKTPPMKTRCNLSSDNRSDKVWPCLIGIGSRPTDNELLTRFGYYDYIQKPLPMLSLVEYLKDLFHEDIYTSLD